jgi:hypothetical protein
MAIEYKPGVRNHAPVNPVRCKASVTEKGRWSYPYQCKRMSWRDGWCKQHHPDTEAKRAKESQERYERQRANSPSRKLADLRQEYDAVLCQRDQLIKACEYASTCLSLVRIHKILDDAIKAVEGEQ